MNNKIKSEVAIGIILAFAVMIGGIFWIGNKKQVSLPAQTKKAQNDSFVSNPSNNILANGTPIIMQDNEISWYGQPKPIESINLFKKGAVSDVSVKTWEMGEIKNTEEKIIFAAVDPNDPGGVREYFFAVSKAGGINPYSRYSTGNFLDDFGNDTVSSDVILRDDNYDRIHSLEYPGLASFNGMVFQYERDKIFDLEDPFFHPERFNVYKKISFDKIYGDVFQNTDDGGIYLKSPMGVAKVYSLRVDFLDGDIPRISWNDGVKTQDPFTYRGVGGCGGSKYADDVSGQISMDELMQTGKTTTGEIVYEYKDKNTEYLKKWYQENVDFIKKTGDVGYSDFKKDTLYDTFISKHLVFFWKDPLGRLIRFVDTNYVFGGGCGKPVIYLYPEQTTKISVHVTPTGNMTASDPDYNQGWNVIADPQSNLTNVADGKTYPYLFWEGRGNSIYQMPENGFVVSQENLENLLDDKLSRLGLISKEISDFKDFWLPKMLAENKPYYFVTFVSRQEIDILAPLSISPRPDTIIRVLMDYKGIDKYENASGLNIKTPERKGFIAVEWGGVLR